MALADEHAAPSTGAVRGWAERIPMPYWIAGIILVFMPAFASDFVLYQIFGWTFILGMIALSLMLLGGYGGMVSLAQMTVAGVAGYMVAIFGNSAITDISQGWPWFVAIPLALLIAVGFATVTGWLAVRTEGIYTIMITLAIAAAFFYFCRQNYVIFNGFSGFNGVLPPALFGVDWRGPKAFYYLTLFWALISYFAVVYLSRSPFGLALQGVRDNPRRNGSFGLQCHGAPCCRLFILQPFRQVSAGILLTWQSAQISPAPLVSVRPLTFSLSQSSVDCADPSALSSAPLSTSSSKHSHWIFWWRSALGGERFPTADRSWFPADRILLSRWHFWDCGIVGARL